jgi:hypothetical protein
MKFQIQVVDVNVVYILSCKIFFYNGTKSVDGHTSQP